MSGRRFCEAADLALAVKCVDVDAEQQEAMDAALSAASAFVDARLTRPPFLVVIPYASAEEADARMTGEDFRRLAGESGETADALTEMFPAPAFVMTRGGVPTDPVVHLRGALDRVRTLASALAECSSRLATVLDAFDPLDASTPEAVIDMALMDIGADPIAIAERGRVVVAKAKADRAARA